MPPEISQSWLSFLAKGNGSFLFFEFDFPKLKLLRQPKSDRITPLAMILAHDKILEELERGNIQVDPFSKNQIGPGSIDLHLGNTFRKFKQNNGLFTVSEDVNFETITELVEIAKDNHIRINPQEAILGTTREKITLAPNLCGWIEGRSRFARIGLGVHITSGFMQPGVSNHQILEITNLGPTPLALCPGIKICQIVIQRCDGSATYQGRWRDQVTP